MRKRLILNSEILGFIRLLSNVNLLVDYVDKPFHEWTTKFHDKMTPNSAAWA